MSTIYTILEDGRLHFSEAQSASWDHTPEASDWMSLEIPAIIDPATGKPETFIPMPDVFKTALQYTADARIIDGGILTGDLHRELLHRLKWPAQTVNKWGLHKVGGLIRFLELNNTSSCLQLLTTLQMCIPQQHTVHHPTCLAIRKVDTMHFGRHAQIYPLSLCSAVAEVPALFLPSISSSESLSKNSETSCLQSKRSDESAQSPWMDRCTSLHRPFSLQRRTWNAVCDTLKPHHKTSSGSQIRRRSANASATALAVG